MTEFKYKHSEHVSRHAAGRRLIALGEALVDAARLELEMDDRCLDLPVGDHLELSYRAKARSGGVELGLVLVWPATEPSPPDVSHNGAGSLAASGGA